jgi:tRNA-specific 2-thiouridylase
MNDKKNNVFVALSGGVDSSTTLALLMQSGCDCSAVFMITNNQAQPAQTDAQKTADKLGVRLYVLDVREQIEKISEYFCRQYKIARTPNPCVMCNRTIKFGKLLDFALNKGADFLATGHYAGLLKTGEEFAIYTSADKDKDQSYALAMIKKEVLNKIKFPLGNYTKNQIKKTAAELGLTTHNKPESQEICFIPDNDYISFIENRCPDIIREGNIIDTDGKILGRHNGIHRFTIGQRRGLKTAMGKPYYVAALNPQTNTVTLGPKDEVMKKRLFAGQMNWLCKKPDNSFRAKVKIRYNSKAAPALIKPEQNGLIIEFDTPVSAITPGQLAALYIEDTFGDRLIGGGWIEKAAD